MITQTPPSPVATLVGLPEIGMRAVIVAPSASMRATVLRLRSATQTLPYPIARPLGSTPRTRATIPPLWGSRRTTVRLGTFPAQTARPSLVTNVEPSSRAIRGPRRVVASAPARNSRRSIVPPPVGGVVWKSVAFATQTASRVTAMSRGRCTPAGNSASRVRAPISVMVLAPMFPTQTESFPAAIGPGIVAHDDVVDELVGLGVEHGHGVADDLDVTLTAAREDEPCSEHRGHHDRCGAEDPRPARPALRRGCSAAVRWRERRVLAQDRALELPEGRGWLDAQLVVERGASVAVGGQRVALPARPVEGEHQLAPEPFSKRICGDERLELGDERAVAAAREICVDAVLDCS